MTEHRLACLVIGTWALLLIVVLAILTFAR